MHEGNVPDGLCVEFLRLFNSFCVTFYVMFANLLSFFNFDLYDSKTSPDFLCFMNDILVV